VGKFKILQTVTVLYMPSKPETKKLWWQSRTMITVTYKTKDGIENLGIKSDSFETLVGTLLELRDKHKQEYQELLQKNRDEINKRKRKSIIYPPLP